jgi:mannosyltransferase
MMIVILAMKKTTTTLLNKVRTRPSLDWVVLGIGLGIFILLACATITKSTIWFDEAFSAYLVQFNYLEVARYTATDVHPPLYYWILKIWTDFFGTTELAFRSLSVLFGASAITFGFLLVRRLFGRKAAWVSLLLLVISPMLIRYGQEARMYTLAATITLAATYVLAIAAESKRRLPWIVYGILVAAGMWTHYFTAIVWLAHWAWRAIVIRQSGKKGKEFKQAFFTKNWVIAHIVAVGLFVPWIPLMLTQLTVIQSSGFWIGPVGADTLTSYMTNVLFYLDHGQAVGWYGAALAVIVTMLAVLGVRLYRNLGKKQRQNYLLILVLAVVPVLILAIVSLPPLRSSFVERYLLPATIGFSLLAGVTLTLGMTKLKSIWRVIAIGIIAVSMLVGVSNVYEYGNYNKNSGTKVATGEVVKEIQRRAKPGEPIITNTPWVFYEAIFYNTSEHPIYFIDADTEYIYGSLDMLKYNDQHKIKDIAAFSAEHPTVWYMGYTQEPSLKAPVSTWEEVQKFSIVTAIDNKDPYKATQFKTN